MPPQAHRSMTSLEWGLLIALSVLWGGSFFLVGIAVHELPPFSLVTLRVGIAALALNLAVAISGQRMPSDLRSWSAFAGMGLLNNAVPFSLLVWGQTQIASGVASILNATTPVFTVIVAHLLTRDERMSAGRLVGVVAGFAGVIVMIGPTVLVGFGTHLLAEFACIGAAVFYACAGVYGRRFKAMGLSPLVTATAQVSASTLMLIPLALIVDQPWALPAPSLVTLGAVLGLGLLATATGYNIYFRLLASAGATNLLLVTFLIPITAIVLGASLLGERIETRHLAGMALIGAGLAAIDGRLARAASAWRRSTRQTTKDGTNVAKH